MIQVFLKLVVRNSIFSHEEVLSLFQMLYVRYLRYITDTGLLTTDCPRFSRHIFLPPSWTELAGRRSKYVTNGTRQHKKSSSLDKTERTLVTAHRKQLQNSITWQFSTHVSPTYHTFNNALSQNFHYKS